MRATDNLRTAVAVLLLAFARTALADGNVVTIGGGWITTDGPFNGFTDGNTFEQAQFNSPGGVAVDNAGHLFVADRDNGAIRVINNVGDKSASLTTTLLTNLPKPIAVAVDAATNLYVLTAGDGLVRKYTSFGNFVTNWPALTLPTALALDANTNIFVAESGGAVKRLNPTNAGPAGVVVILPSGTFHKPQGIAALNSGLLAVSDTGSNAVYLVNPLTKTVKLLAGNNGPGFTNGPPPYAAFNQPWNLFQAPSGNLVVADRGNQRVRLISTTGTVTTLYGVDPSFWDPGFPGWYDGAGADFGTNAAACRDPVGVTIDNAGVVYTTEDYYHIIREVTGSGFTGTGGTNGAGSNAVVVLPPTFSPNSGYYPMGQTISVSNPNSSDFFTPAVYYTTDGTDPTTNSLQVALTNNTGVILWRNTTNDLTSLKLKAFLGSFASSAVSGQPVTVNAVGIPPGLNTNVLAGIGSTIVLPVVVNLGTNQTLATLQYRIDLTPEEFPTGHFAPNILPSGFFPLSFSTNDSILIAGASATPGAIVTNLFLELTNATGGVVTSEMGEVTLPNHNLLVKNFAAVGLLAVHIPPTAVNGDRYKLVAKYPEGTSDGFQTAVMLTNLPPVEIVVSTNVHYLVGDSGPGYWYNAEVGTGFGEGNVAGDDVNSVFLASLGLRTPFPFTDLFDAMDVFPEDIPGTAGGDGQIRFLDWQVTLMRALRFETNNWTRAWAPGGIRLPLAANLTGSADSPALKITDPPPGAVWVRQVAIRAGSVPMAQPGTTVTVPIFLNVVPGASISGMVLSVVVTNTASSGAQIVLPASFVPGPGISPPQIPDAGVPVPPNVAGGGWGFGAFNPALQGSNLLGHINFVVPPNAPAGTRYDIQFLAADGSPAPTNGVLQQYDWETLPGVVLVLSTNLPPASITSFEWKTNFFGTADNPLAADNADPDGDGVPNWAEYLAGTDPTNALSRLQLLPPALQGNGSMVLSWLSAPYRAYTLESAADANAAAWTTVSSNLLGTGDILQASSTNSTAISRFYRIRLQP